MLLVAIATLLCLLGAPVNSAKNLKLVNEWNQMEFVFPYAGAREQAQRLGHFIDGRSIPIDVDLDYKKDTPSRVFVTIPRFSDGVPVTLGYISSDPKKLQPYPDYSWHESYGNDCDGITSVFRVAIDECRRLWVLDTGRIADRQHCAPQILIFNLDNDSLIHRYRFPQALYKSGVSLFITPVLDVKDPPPNGRCFHAKAYMADVTGFGLVVYDSQSDSAWRIQNKLLYPNPNFGTHSVAGEQFELMDGVFGLAMSPRLPYESQDRSNRLLYFHSLASNTENSVRLNVLNNRTMWDASVESSPREFNEIGVRGSQATSQAMDSNGNLFFGLERPTGIACWDSSRPYNEHSIRIVAQNDQTLQFISGLKVIRNIKGEEELWVLSDRFQKVMTGSMNPQETNFRILALKIEELLDGSRCTGGSSGRPQGPAYPGNHRPPYGR